MGYGFGWGWFTVAVSAVCELLLGRLGLAVPLVCLSVFHLVLRFHAPAVMVAGCVAGIWVDGVYGRSFPIHAMVLVPLTVWCSLGWRRQAAVAFLWWQRWAPGVFLGVLLGCLYGCFRAGFPFGGGTVRRFFHVFCPVCAACAVMWPLWHGLWGMLANRLEIARFSRRYLETLRSSPGVGASEVETDG